MILLRRSWGVVVIGLKTGTCLCTRPNSHIAQTAQLMPISKIATRSTSLIRSRSQWNTALFSPFDPTYSVVTT
jgi:hypothetical protein